MLGVVAAALVFAIVGLSVGLTKGSSSEDKKRAATLEQQVKDAKQARSAAVAASHGAATKAENYQNVFQQMLSFGDQQQNLANQQLAAALAGNLDQFNALVTQANTVKDQHNAITDQLNALPKP